MSGNVVTSRDAQIGQRIRWLRSARSLTQQQLADRMRAAGYKMVHSSISKIESGGRPLLASEAITMASVLGVTTGDLLSSDATGVNAALTELWQRVEALEAVRERYDMICRIVQP